MRIVLVIRRNCPENFLDKNSFLISHPGIPFARLPELILSYHKFVHNLEISENVLAQKWVTRWSLLCMDIKSMVSILYCRLIVYGHEFVSWYGYKIVVGHFFFYTIQIFDFCLYYFRTNSRTPLKEGWNWLKMLSRTWLSGCISKHCQSFKYNKNFSDT